MRGAVDGSVELMDEIHGAVRGSVELMNKIHGAVDGSVELMNKIGALVGLLANLCVAAARGHWHAGEGVVD